MEAKLDCGDNSCEFAEHKTGMRTNGGCRCLKDLDFTRRMAVRGYIKALREQVAQVRGAMSADDGRLEAAAKRVWGEHIWGCDTPDQMADLILGLREENARLREELRIIADANPAVWEPDVRGQFREWTQSRARAALRGTEEGK